MVIHGSRNCDHASPMRWISSDVYLASTFSPINNSMFRESCVSLCLSLPLSLLFLYHSRCPVDESSGLTRALLRLSNECPLFTRLRNSAWFYNTYPLRDRIYAHSSDRRIDRASNGRCFPRNDHIPARRALDRSSRIFLFHFSCLVFLLFILVARE